MKEILIGVDEAGRGPVIGPMVMAAFAIEKDKEQNLQNLEVKDSKLIAPLKRNTIYKKLITNYEYEKIIISPQQIDLALNDTSINLNWLEAIISAKACSKLIKRINSNNITIILDCPSNNLLAYENYFKNQLQQFPTKKIKIITEHKADLNYLCAGAASIIAKVTRDTEIQKIKNKIKIDIGSGYPADPKTKQFLIKNYDKYPEIFRKTWKSWKKIAQSKKQKNLGEF
jgi:ribonuclease HII